MAVDIDKKGAWSPAAAASADVSTARSTRNVAKAAVAAVDESLKDALRLTEAAASCVKEAPGLLFAVYIPHLDEL